MDPVHALQAEVCRTLSHPTRIAALHLLAAGPRTVHALSSELGISQPNASQHLSLMRAAGLVEPERDGREVTYRLTDPGIIDACELMARVMHRRLARMATLSAQLDAGAALLYPDSTATANPVSRS